MSAPAPWFARLWPALLLAAAAALMVRDAILDPHDPTLTGTARYGHNHEHALPQVLVWCTCELLLLYALLMPGMSPRIWRALIALVLIVPWTLMALTLSMHSGGVVVLHALWLLVVSAGVLLTLIARIVRRVRGG